MKVIDFGCTAYREIWHKQKELQDEIIQCNKKCLQNKEEFILVGEHPSVYTIGFHGNISNLLFDEKTLEKKGCECIRIERGGDITYHGPGQILVYPILDLPYHSLGVKKYVNILEEAVIRLLRRYGITGERIEGATGVWIDKGTILERKICAIGIKVSRGVSIHGLALNVNTDLEWFRAINPCGFTDKGVTSMGAEIKKNLDIAVIKHELVEILMDLL
ncbi:MAG: lipoyl(octanoyl) transferase LipB [Muribaculaceae bacterium]|nr:lipoyl(octanoyl) transferase LipB [Muribaculaceae bacterium]